MLRSHDGFADEFERARRSATTLLTADQRAPRSAVIAGIGFGLILGFSGALWLLSHG
jgi:hypothetical protein